MCIHMCIYIYIYTHTYIHTYIHKRCIPRAAPLLVPEGRADARVGGGRVLDVSVVAELRLLMY